MKDQSYCYPLTIINDHSLFSIKIAPGLSTKNVVIPMFQEVFSEYRLPDAILFDNGAWFADFRKGYTKFERWLMELDIPPTHGRIKHPPTQGKIERFHRTMKQELLNHASPTRKARGSNPPGRTRKPHCNVFFAMRFFVFVSV
jgi:transposase InsO family protein